MSSSAIDQTENGTKSMKRPAPSEFESVNKYKRNRRLSSDVPQKANTRATITPIKTTFIESTSLALSPPTSASADGPRPPPLSDPPLSRSSTGRTSPTAENYSRFSDSTSHPNMITSFHQTGLTHASNQITLGIDHHSAAALHEHMIVCTPYHLITLLSQRFHLDSF